MLLVPCEDLKTSPCLIVVVEYQRNELNDICLVLASMLHSISDVVISLRTLTRGGVRHSDAVADNGIVLAACCCTCQTVPAEQEMYKRGTIDSQNHHTSCALTALLMMMAYDLVGCCACIVRSFKKTYTKSATVCKRHLPQ